MHCQYYITCRPLNAISKLPIFATVECILVSQSLDYISEKETMSFRLHEMLGNGPRWVPSAGGLYERHEGLTNHDRDDVPIN